VPAANEASLLERASRLGTPGPRVRSPARARREKTTLDFYLAPRAGSLSQVLSQDYAYFLSPLTHTQRKTLSMSENRPKRTAFRPNLAQ
jgi:hypothetical protein